MTEYGSNFDGGLIDNDEPKVNAKAKAKTKAKPSNSTEYEAKVQTIGSLEQYMANNSLEFDKTESASMRINVNLYKYMSNLFNVLKRDGHLPGSIIRFNSLILNLGVKVFDDKINPKQFDKLLLKVGKYADGCVLCEFDSNHALNKLDEPGYTFDSIYTKNWNQKGSTVTTNYYKNEMLGTKFAHISTLGFNGKNGSKLTREFVLLLGLKQSETLRENSRAYTNIVKITDITLNVFEQLVTQASNE